MDNIRAKIEEALMAEINNNILKAAEIYSDLLKNFADGNGELLFSSASFLLRQGIGEASLRAFVKCFELGYEKDTVLGIILDAFYVPNINEFVSRYEKNKIALSYYEHMPKKEFKDFSCLRYMYIPLSENKYVIFDKTNNCFVSEIAIEEDAKIIFEYDKNDIKVFIINDNYNIKSIVKYEENTHRQEMPDSNVKLPLYLYFSDWDKFESFLQAVDFEGLIANKRVVFFFNLREMEEWFNDLHTILPTHVYFENSDIEFSEYIDQLYKTREKNINIIKNDIEEYYVVLKPEYFCKKFKNNSLKVLFISSRTSTFIKYCIRDCIEACSYLGISSDLEIDVSEIHRINEITFLQKIKEFKPDAIFMIDHFRWEMPGIPCNIPFISWLQDDLNNVMSKKSAENIGSMDFVVNFMVDDLNEFKKYGYKTEDFINGIIPANDNLYKKYLLTDEETLKYEADISNVTHAGNPFKGLESALVHEEYAKLFTTAFERIYEIAQANGHFYTQEQYEKMFYEIIHKYNIAVSDELIGNLARYARLTFGTSIFRSMPLVWLSEKGYKIKLWGLGWDSHPKLKKYSAGCISNGEELSKVLNASKISLGVYPTGSAHMRAFESILSNSFYLCRHTPPEYEKANLKNCLIENKEVVFFYDKEDLLRKVDFYLNNEEKRNEILTYSYKKVLENYTYKVFIKRIISEIADKIQKKNRG